MGDQRPWYDAAFEAGYLDVYPHRDLAAARAEVAGLLGRADVRAPVLDLGCGFGRHLVALRERGVEAFGLDRSLALLSAAEGVRGRIARGDFRALPFRAGAFGSVWMLFSSFGYFDDRENARVAREVARVLAPGGQAVFDLMNPARVRALLVAESTARRGALEIHERRRLERGGTRVVKEVRVREPGAAERYWREDVRLYEREECAALLAGAGFVVERVEGDFDGRPLAADSARQIVWASRPPLSARASG